MFPNDFAALACLARAYRLLRGTFTLMVWGYGTEAQVLLRSVYEAAALARMLAKDPTRAEKWVRKQQWFPDREVRSWFANAGANNASTPEEILKIYGTAYKQGSVRAHPTAIACMSALDISEQEGVTLSLRASFQKRISETARLKSPRLPYSPALH